MASTSGTAANDYILLFRVSEAAQREAMGTPEMAQKSMQGWLAWVRRLEEHGHVKDPGQPLDRAGKVVRGQQKLVTDGPYAEAKDIVAGFMLITARDIDQAAELAAGCPILAGEGSVEIRPVLTMAPTSGAGANR